MAAAVRAASLHVTLSTAQQNAWADLLELSVPQAMAAAIQQSQASRCSLPTDYLNYMGAAYSDRDQADQRRLAFKANFRLHMTQVVEQALQLVDAAADQMGKRYLSDRLPPCLSPAEEAHTAEGEAAAVEINGLTHLRMVRRGIARLVLEEGVAVVYHTMENARSHHGAPMQVRASKLKE